MTQGIDELLQKITNRPGKRKSDRYMLKLVDVPIFRGGRIIGIRTHAVPVDPKSYIPFRNLFGNGS